MVAQRLPGRLALFEERADAFACLRPGARIGEHRGGFRGELRRQRRVLHALQQFLGALERLGSRLREPCAHAIHRRIQLRRRHAFVHEADALRLGRGQPLAGQHVAARLRRAHGAHQVRTDHRRHQAAARLGQRKLGFLRRDDEVAGGRESHAAGDRRTVHARNDRLEAITTFRDLPQALLAAPAPELSKGGTANVWWRIGISNAVFKPPRRHGLARDIDT